MGEIQWPFVISFIAYFVVIWAIAHRVATRIRTCLELSVGGRVVSYLAFAFLVSGTFISAVSVFGGMAELYRRNFDAPTARLLPMKPICGAWRTAVGRHASHYAARLRTLLGISQPHFLHRLRTMWESFPRG
ncbi:MAG: hypothetical protein LN412_07695 [Candidatus Thermoplasmatota archaeon]|nr:hypothetical protein [Candidatus Thermoplasmatota archaeon]